MMQLLQGDCLTMLATLPAQSVQTVVTSPPYYGLRSYNGGDAEIGLEDTPEEYIAKLIAVFRQVKRVLREDGTCWVNLGDSYARPLEKGGSGTPNGRNGRGEEYRGAGLAGLPAKNLLGIPWRVAFALQADGWYLRSDIIWHKPNPMPESVTDRPTKAHEYIFLLSKSERYFYDSEAIKEPSITNDPRRPYTSNGAKQLDGRSEWHSGQPRNGVDFSTRNRRTVWTVSTKPFSGSHFAVFPPDLIEPCILAGTSAKGCCPECGKGWERVVEKKVAPPEVFTNRAAPEDGMVYSGSIVDGKWRGQGQKLQDWRDANPPQTVGWQQACGCPAAEPVPCVVLDPFAGAGTTGVVSVKHGRAFVGVELNPDYHAMALARIEAEIARPKQLGLAI